MDAAAMDGLDGFRIGCFGDLRRERAGALFFQQVVTTGSIVLRQVGGDRAGEVAAQRFLGCPRVTVEEITLTAGRRTAQACAGRRIVAAQDTTEVNFSGRDRSRRDLGPAGDGKSLGYFCHGMVAIDADDEAVLGVVDAQIWTRPDEAAPPLRSRPIEEKESIRWINASMVAADLLASAAQLIIVGDRESDIYAQFARRPVGADLIVRAAHDRKLDDDEQLFDAPSQWRACGTMTIQVPPKRQGDAGRTAIVTVKAGEVCIRKPRHGAAAEDAATVTLTYVEVREMAPPAGHKPIIWRLLTTLKVVGQADAFAAAQEIVRLYRLRWRIEQVFRAMKSDGLRLEETQIKEAERLFKITAIALIAAVRTIQLVDARDGSARPATDVANEQQIAAAEIIAPTAAGGSVGSNSQHSRQRQILVVNLSINRRDTVSPICNQASKT